MRTKLVRGFISTILFGALIATVTSCQSPEGPKVTGWRPIFDGKSTNGWRMTGPGEFRLENGHLVTHGGMGLFWYSREKFGNCRIRVVFKLTTPRDNSGVFIRIPEPPSDPWYAVHHGYEVQIANGGSEWHRTGTLYSMSRATQPVEARVNEWNTMIITLDGKRTLVEVNGVPVTDFVEGTPVPPRTKEYEPERRPRPDFGYIGLQNHDDHARVHFREVSVAPLKR